MKPFIKWAGGKTKMLPEIRKRMPDKYSLYVEPFVGGGAVYFDIMPDIAVISDSNKPLMTCYSFIKECPRVLMGMLEEMEDEFNNLPDEDKEEFYYIKRKRYNSLVQREFYSVETACLFIFLNKTCFNGLYRTNKTGVFNCPFSRKKKISLFDKENFLAISKQLSDTQILHGDFEQVCIQADLQKGDFVFFDSPYVQTFNSYGKDGFKKEDHLRLYNLFKELSMKGIYCMLTNNDCDYVHNLYKDFSIEKVEVMHAINRDGSNRRGNEVIIKNY